MDLRNRWWNGQWGRLGRCDIWLETDGERWYVRGREGGADGHEARFDFAHEWLARAQVERLMEARPGQWRDITRLVSKPHPNATPATVDPAEPE